MAMLSIWRQVHRAARTVHSCEAYKQVQFPRDDKRKKSAHVNYAAAGEAHIAL